MARDDWFLWFEDYLFICVSRGGFDSTGEVNQRIGEALAMVAAMPGVMHQRVDHSTDDLVARIDRIESIEDAMTFLQGLTTAERERLARSNTPLADFADVQSPMEAMARLQSMDVGRRAQLLAMFQRVENEHRR
jgi:hypothetical protein